MEAAAMRLGRRNGGGRRSFGDLLSNQQIYRALSYRPASYTVPRCARLFIRLQMNKEGRSMLAESADQRVQVHLWIPI